MKPFKAIFYTALALAGALLLTGCKPELVAHRTAATVVDSGGVENVKVTVQVQNMGRAASTESRVYVQGINPNLPEPGEENRIRFHANLVLPSLRPGHTSAPLFALMPLSEYLSEGIEYFDVIVDPKHEVQEQNEENNLTQVRLPSGALSP